MEKINKMFKRMYIAMGFTGVILAAMALYSGYKTNMFTENIYGTMLIVFASLTAITMFSIFFEGALFKNADKLKLSVIRGHIAAFFGFSSYLIILANESSRELSTTLLLLGILAVYIAGMALMFFWMIKRIEKRINESENKKIDG